MQRPTFCTVLLATVILAAACGVAQPATPGFTTLYDFGSPADGVAPRGNLAIGAWTYTVLYTFTGPSGSSHSLWCLALAAYFYGCTLHGGSAGYGTVFALTL
jgi:hypothetical protein